MIEKATLIKGKKHWEVELKTKKGSSRFPILGNAKFFRETDAREGAEVNVIREKGNLTKVSIEGKPEINPGPVTKKRTNPTRHPRKQTQNSQKPRNTNEMQQAGPEILGEPFYNPYTFIPFTENPVTERFRHTPLSADDDKNGEYLTGIIRLKVTTESPLMSHDKGAENEKGHKIYQMLRIGGHVVVPATSVKGFLRNLTTILSGGPLNMLDEYGYLCPGRDVQIQGENGKAPLLGRVEEPGDVFRNGSIQLGDSRFISTLALARHMDKQGRNKRWLDQLEKAVATYEDLKKARKSARQENDHRSANELTGKMNRISRSHRREVQTVERLIADLRGADCPVWVLPDEDRVKDICYDTRPNNHYWQLKISGPPIQGFNKKEGLFRPDGPKLTIPPDLWAEYASRNMHATRKTLEKNDLAWLEVEVNCGEITHHSQIRSLQWARWGRKGDRVLDRIRQGHVKPEWMSAGTDIHPVTNMFGLGSPSPKFREGLSVASKLRFDNLVFRRDAKVLDCQPIATLASPHPGCLAFYRDNPDSRSVSSEDSLKGYKVYRTAEEQGKVGPWNYHDVQPIYDRGGRDIIPGESRENVFSSELLAPGAEGDLEIAFRSLTKDELSLLLTACTIPWRLGGGKPLGLGLCRVSIRDVIDELGQPIEYETPGSGKFVDQNQLEYWIASQTPVRNLRYPRAVITNRKNTLRGGHTWFSKMAKPKQVGSTGPFEGLMPIYGTDDLKNKADKNIRHHEGHNEHEHSEITPVKGTVLPALDPTNSSADRLYGYDIHFDDNHRQKKEFNRKRHTDCYPGLKKFRH